MKKSSHVVYERTRDSLKISGDADKIDPYIRNDQQQVWFKMLASAPFEWIGRYSGLSFIVDKIRRFRSG